MMNDFIHCSKPYVLLPTTRDEILSWMIEIRIKNHLVSDNNCNIVKSTNPQETFAKNNEQCWAKHLVLVRFTISIGDIKYHIYCGKPLVDLECRPHEHVD